MDIKPQRVLGAPLTNADHKGNTNMSLDLDRISQLILAVEKIRNYPRLKTLHDMMMQELEEFEEKAKEDLIRPPAIPYPKASSQTFSGSLLKPAQPGED